MKFTHSTSKKHSFPWQLILMDELILSIPTKNVRYPGRWKLLKKSAQSPVAGWRVLCLFPHTLVQCFCQPAHVCMHMREYTPSSWVNDPVSVILVVVQQVNQDQLRISWDLLDNSVQEVSNWPGDFRAGEETLSMVWRCTDLHKWFEDASSGFFGDADTCILISNAQMHIVWAAGSFNLVRAQVDYYWCCSSWQ